MAVNIVEFQGKITSVHDHMDVGVPQIRILRVAIPEGVSMPFKPGQFVMIAMESFKLFGDASKLRWAAYSVCSIPSQREIELCIRLKDTAGLSNYIRDNAKVGASMNIRGTYGTFFLNETANRYIFVATGTGIAPIISMIRELVRIGSTAKMELFFGFRGKKYYLYGDELKKYSAKNKNMRIHTASSKKDEPDFVGHKGFVQDLLRESTFEEPENTLVYICGLPEMVKDVRELLPTKGFKKENIKFEQW